MQYVSKRVAITIAACLMVTMAIPVNVFADVSALNQFAPNTIISSGAVNSNFNILRTQMPAGKTVTEAWGSHGLVWTNPVICGGTANCGWTLIKSITVTTPTSGMVIVLASGFLQSSGKTVGQNSSAWITVSSSNTTEGPNIARFAWGQNMTHDWYNLPFSIHSAFTVPSAGTYTYYLIGKNDSSVNTITSDVWQPQITAIFTPNILP